MIFFGKDCVFMIEKYSKVIDNFANEIMGVYRIVPTPQDDFESTLTDFELIKNREDNCQAVGIKPYDFISKHIKENYIDDIRQELGTDCKQSSLIELIDLIAEKIYHSLRCEIAESERFDNEINRIILKYAEKYQLDTLDEMYDKCDIYDEVGREDFVSVRMTKWNKVLENDREEVVHDVVLSGLYEETSSENKTLAEKVIMPGISRALAVFERDNLEGGLKKRDIEYAKLFEER